MIEVVKTEIHPFGVFLPSGANKLILGSFPCFNKKQNTYGDWFYSGSGRNLFWKLMAHVFELPAENVQQKRELCKVNKMAVTDIAYKIERLDDNCQDSNLKIHEYNDAGIRKCLDSGINTVICTSQFVENILKEMFPKENFETVVLPSPSPSLNRIIARRDEYKELKLSGAVQNTFEYRLLKYKELFNAHR